MQQAHRHFALLLGERRRRATSEVRREAPERPGENQSRISPWGALQTSGGGISRKTEPRTFSTWLPPWLAKADSGSYWYFASAYISIVRRKQAEKALALSAFFLAFGCGSSCGATPSPDATPFKFWPRHRRVAMSGRRATQTRRETSSSSTGGGHSHYPKVLESS